MVIKQTLILECNAMVNYALGKGLSVPSSVVEDVEKYKIQNTNDEENTNLSECIDSLNTAHSQLSKIVSPAKPSTLALFDKEAKNSVFKFLGPVPLVRRMVFIAILSLISLIVLGVSPHVNGDPNRFSLMSNDGISLLYNQLFLISASAIGASFAALFQVNSFIKTATFELMYESTYWVRFVLGLLAGTMLATLLPIEDIQDKISLTNGFGQPLLALLGGFSAPVVFRILTRLTTAVETIFKGDAKGIIASKEMQNSMKLEQQNMQNKLQLLSQLKTLQSKMNDGSDMKTVVDELNQIQDSLLGK